MNIQEVLVALHFSDDKNKEVRIHNIKGPCEFSGFRSGVADISFHRDTT
jgi:hypothetical protein